MIVLVPAYQPDGRLLTLLDVLRTAEAPVRLLVVDDGSGSAYRHLFDAARELGCTVVAHPANRGKGAALKTGFAFVAATWPDEGVVCADSDGQHSVVDILRVAEHVRRGQALVLGVRTLAGDVPARSRFGNTVTRALFRLATRARVADTQTGLRGYSAALLPWLLGVRGDRFEYELNVLLSAARRGHTIEQVEIATIYLDGNASSHFRPVVDSARIYAPLLAFLLSSFTAFLLDTTALLVLDAVAGSLLLAVVGARVLSSTVNFLVNRHLVFASTAPRTLGAALARYCALAGSLLAVNFLVLTALTAVGLALLPAKLVTEVNLVACSYQVQRRVVFSRSRAEGAEPAVVLTERAVSTAS